MASTIGDGHYFKGVAESHEKKLLKLVEVSENYLKNCVDLPDQYRGLLTSAVGNTKLLVKEKINQFFGLCQTHLTPKEGELPITKDDLAGFWDLIMIEVRLLYKNFKYLADCAKDNWKKPLEDVELVEVKKATAKPTTKKKFAGVKSVIKEEIKKSRNKGSPKQDNDVPIIIYQANRTPK